jgi:hypothetical protein
VVVFLAFAFSCFFWVLLQLPLDPALDCHGPQCTLFVRLSLCVSCTVAGRAAFVRARRNLLIFAGSAGSAHASAQAFRRRFAVPLRLAVFSGVHQGADNHP